MPIGQREQTTALAGRLSNGGTSGKSLDESLQSLKGIGPQVALALGKLGLNTVGDLLKHIPRRWEDRTNFRRVADVQSGEWVTVHGVVIAVTTKYPKPRMTITEALLDDNGSALKLVWFNQPFMERTFKGLQVARRPVVVYGQAKRSGWTVE